MTALATAVKQFEEERKPTKPVGDLKIYEEDSPKIYLTDSDRSNITIELEDRFLYQPMNASTMTNLNTYLNTTLSNYAYAGTSGTQVTFNNCTFDTGTATTLPINYVDHVAHDEHKDYFSVNRPNLTASGGTWVTGYTVDHASSSVEVTFRTDQYNLSTEGNICLGSNGVEWSMPASKQDFARRQMRSNLVIKTKTRAEEFALQGAPQNELLALETLREMVSEEAFRKYLKYGFILVEGQDGRVYQIFRNKWHTKVWRGGQLIEEICVRISSDVKAPATDNVVAFKTMIEADEDEFRKIGNVYRNLHKQAA